MTVHHGIQADIGTLRPAVVRPTVTIPTYQFAVYTIHHDGTIQTYSIYSYSSTVITYYVLLYRILI